MQLQNVEARKGYPVIALQCRLVTASSNAYFITEEAEIVEKQRAFAWKAGTRKNAGRPLCISLGRQFILLPEKIHSIEADTHGFVSANELTRQVALPLVGV